jgi:uncharacterized protein (TIGR02246 family)
MLVHLVRFFIFFLSASVLFVSGSCQLNGDDIRTTYANNVTGNTQQEIKTLLDQYIAALQQRDLVALNRIWADDLSFINLYGDLLNKQNRMDNIKSGATAFKSIKLSDVDVRVYSQAAVATFKVAIEAQYSGQESSGNYNVTTVWAQPKGTWQLVAVHMTQMK